MEENTKPWNYEIKKHSWAFRELKVKKSWNGHASEATTGWDDTEASSALNLQFPLLWKTLGKAERTLLFQSCSCSIESIPYTTYQHLYEHLPTGLEIELSSLSVTSALVVPITMN